MARTGRPSKLTDEVREKADEYVNGGWRELGHNIPLAAGLARHIGVGKRTLYDWAENDDDFSHTLEQLNSEQEAEAIQKGISGEFNSTITKLVLANHNYGEKAEVAHTGPGGAPLTFKWES